MPMRCNARVRARGERKREIGCGRRRWGDASLVRSPFPSSSGGDASSRRLSHSLLLQSAAAAAMVTRPTVFFWAVTAVTAAGIWAIHATQVEEREVGGLAVNGRLLRVVWQGRETRVEQAGTPPPAAAACRRRQRPVRSRLSRPLQCLAAAITAAEAAHGSHPRRGAVSSEEAAARGGHAATG